MQATLPLRRQSTQAIVEDVISGTDNSPAPLALHGQCGLNLRKDDTARVLVPAERK